MDALRAQGHQGREAVEAALASHHPDHAALEEPRSVAAQAFRAPATRFGRHQRPRPAKPRGKRKR